MTQTQKDKAIAVLLGKYDKKHLANLLKRKKVLDAIYEDVAQEAARIGVACPFDDPNKPFYLNDYPAAKQRVEKLIKNFVDKVETSIVEGDKEEWLLSAQKNAAMVNFLTKGTKIPEDKIKAWKQPNLDALTAFQERKTNGMGLSDRVWNLGEQTKSELELCLDVGLGHGKSAAELSRDVRQYLKEPHKLFRRVRDKEGNLRLSKNAQAYHSGRGVYRSSYKNALRMTATENNMAYRTADHNKWQQLDFVIGIDIHLSNNHTLNGKPFTDICDMMVGKYPKEFKFTGWHPFCRCIATTILADWNEVLEQMDSDNPHYTGEVKEMPEGYKQWIEDNAERIAQAKSMPYFIKDNYVGGKVENGLALNKINKIAVTNTRKTEQHTEINNKNINATDKNNVSDTDIQNLLKRTTFGEGVEPNSKHIQASLREVATIEKEYGIKLKELKLYDNANSKLGGHSTKEGIIVVNVGVKDSGISWKDANGNRYYHDVGLKPDASKTQVGRAISIHEMGHQLVSANALHAVNPYTWEQYREKFKGSGLKVAQIKDNFVKYQERTAKQIEKLKQEGKLEFYKELSSLFNEYKANKTARLSKYSEFSVEEFVSEAFTHARLYGKGNPYADKVKNIIDEMYRSKTDDKLLSMDFSKIEGKVKSVIKSANISKDFANENIISERTALQVIRSAFTGSKGVKEIEILSPEYNAFGGYDRKTKTIRISNNTLMQGLDSYNVMINLRRGIAKIKTGIELTKEEEYAFECLHHERLHASAKGWKGKKKELLSKPMEALNQLCARHSYERTLSKFGRLPIHKDSIIEKGFGYNVSITNLRKLIAKAGIEENEFIARFRVILQDSYYEDIGKELIKFFSSKGIKKASSLIYKLDTNYDEFERLLRM